MDITADQIIEIRFQISSVYSDSSLILTKDGSIKYEAFASDEVQADDEKGEKKISPDRFMELAQLIIEKGFYGFPDNNTDESLCDGDTESITVKSLHHTKTVTCYGSYPEGFSDIEDMIQELWGKPILTIGF